MKFVTWLRMCAAIAFVCLLLAPVAHAQQACATSGGSGYTLITATHIGGQLSPTPSATLYVQPMSGLTSGIGAARVGTAGGQALSVPYTATVTAGVVNCGVPDTLLTNPATCDAITVIDSSQTAIIGAGLAPDGVHVQSGGPYGCAQPNGTTWSLDSYVPSMPVSVLPTSLFDSPGTTTGAPGTLAAASVSTVGPGQYHLSFTIPTGAAGPNCSVSSPPGHCDLGATQLDAGKLGNTFYADGFPSLCVINAVTYTSQLECAWQTALATVPTATSNPTVVVGSGGGTNYTTCVGLPLIPSGYTGRYSVNLVNAAQNASLFFNNTPTGAVITQTCSISTGVVYLPDVPGSGTKTVTVSGVSVNANGNAPYALQLIGTNYDSVMHNDVWIGGTGTAVALVGDGPGAGWTFSPDFQHWTILPGACPITNGCGSGATATVALSGGAPTVTVTAGGTNYDANTHVTLLGYQNGTNNVPCSSMGAATPTISGGVITAITSTATGCVGTVYVAIYDASPQQYGLVVNGLSDAANLSGFDIQAGYEAALYLQDAGTSTFHNVHPWAGGLYGVQTADSAVSVSGTDCGELSAACFNIKGTSTRVHVINTMYNSANQYAGFSMFRVDNSASTASVAVNGLTCQTTQAAEYHTLATTSGVYDGLGGTIGPGKNQITQGDYCGSGTGANSSATAQPVANLGLVQSNHVLFFSYSAGPFVACMATGYAAPPTISGSVITFGTDGSHNGGGVQCSDSNGTRIIQSVPNTGGTAQTFDLTTQFATSGTAWVQIGNNFITLNAPSVFVQNGTLAKGTGGTVAADTVGGLVPPPNGFMKFIFWGQVAGTASVDMTPALPHALTIDSATINFSTAPNCTTYPTLNLWDFTASVSVANVTPSTSATSYTLTVTTPSVPAGHQLAWRTSAYTTCGTNATNGTLNVFYH